MITTSIRDQTDHAPIESIAVVSVPENAHEIVTDAIWPTPTRVYYRTGLCSLALRMHSGETREVAEVGHD